MGIPPRFYWRTVFLTDWISIRNGQTYGHKSPTKIHPGVCKVMNKSVTSDKIQSIIVVL